MATIIHFVDVGQGNMVLIETDDGRKLVFDCNVKEDNEARVLNYIAEQIGEGNALHAFICSHRDADHVRGVKKLHARFPIQEVWDSDYPGTTTDSAEYREYMELRRRVGSNDERSFSTRGPTTMPDDLTRTSRDSHPWSLQPGPGTSGNTVNA